MNPRGYTSAIEYEAKQRWDTAGDADSWVGGVNASVTQSTERAFRGAGSLRMNVNVNYVGFVPVSATAHREYATPVS